VEENHLAARKKVVLEDVEILRVHHLQEEVVILEAAEDHLTDVLRIDLIEILEATENLLADLEENVEKVRNNINKNLNLISHKPMRFFLWKKFHLFLYLLC
jgi:hypothetical protein